MYSESHKIFLQAIMQEGILQDEDSKELIITLFGNEEVKNIIYEINSKLQPLNMMIKTVICEITGDTYWAVTSTILQDISSFQVQFSRAQLELLRKIFSEIITSTNGCVSSTICLNLCSSLDTKLLKIDATEFLDYIVDKKWLTLKNGQYYIGVRSIAELMPYFKETYDNSLHICNLCKEVIFFGQRCIHCEAMMHIICLKRYAEVMHPLQCATCKNHIEVDVIGE
ncbi:non-structural maintenance of chromosomes element 1 homolog isoform X1 [Vespa velutina]|uniref:non-structural maintenance of chromosomes element 1 homolog isoform X1 n=2 Tax=Vespa velutina TaxID=202808 RepID=UPI001FB39216|nr:non-structural maintenance of chromosomes element 1 homolog isoform X1 [Vespa velutina]